MKTNMLPFLLLLVLLSCHSGDDSQARRDELKNVLSDYYNALAQRDSAKLRELTTSNFILFDEGAVYTNESALKAIMKMKPFTVTFAFDSLNVHMDKKNASAYCFRNADFTFNDTVHMSAKFLESATFNKEGDKWKIRFLHSTVRR